MRTVLTKEEFRSHVLQRGKPRRLVTILNWRNYSFRDPKAETNMV